MTSSTYGTYKDSHIPGVDLIPNHWEILPLCAVSKMKSITNCRDKELLSVYLDLGVIRFSDVNEKRTNATSDDLSKYQEVLPGDFVLNNQQAWRGSVGVSKYDGIVSPAYIVLELRDGIDASFANYFFRHGAMVSQYLICSRGVGTIQRNLYWPQLKRVQVALPPLDEQQRITSFLDQKTAEIAEAIAKKQRLIELLKEQKAILINQAVTKGLNPDVPMRDSGVEWIGDMPAHWTFPQFGYCCTVIKDGLHHTPPKYQEGVNFVSTQHVRNRQIDIDDATFISTKAYKEGHPRIRPQAGDVLITLVGSIGFAALVEEIHMPLSFTRHVGYVRCIKQKLNPQYLINYTESHTFKCFIEKNVSQTAQPSIYLSSLAAHKLPLPPIDEQQKIVNWIFANTIPYDQAITNAEREIHLFSELRQVIVCNAVTGKIKI